MRYIELRGASLVGCQEKPFMGGGVNAALQSKAAEAKKKKREKFRAFILFLVFGSKFYTPAPSLSTNRKALNFLHSLCNETWVTLSYTAGEFRVVTTRQQTGPAEVQREVHP